MNEFDKKCDLHIHSSFSDSDMEVEEIFKIASQKKLFALAITDHDTVEAIKKAKEYSKIYNVNLIEGIEISAQEENVEVHLLGYFINSENKRLKDALKNMKELRRERLLLMVDKLNNLGFKIDKEELLLKIKDAIPTRLHLGLYLVEKGFVSSLREAFYKYLSPGRYAYVARFKYSVKEAINLIKDAEGLAFLAHPHFLPKQNWIEKFISFGLDGLEVSYPRLSQERSHFYEDLVEKYKLLKSGGSDAHGTYKEFTEVGGVTISYNWVEKMKEVLYEYR
jgi:hypothetical protein